MIITVYKKVKSQQQNKNAKAFPRFNFEGEKILTYEYTRLYVFTCDKISDDLKQFI